MMTSSPCSDASKACAALTSSSLDSALPLGWVPQLPTWWDDAAAGLMPPPSPATEASGASGPPAAAAFTPSRATPAAPSCQHAARRGAPLARRLPAWTCADLPKLRRLNSWELIERQCPAATAAALRHHRVVSLYHCDGGKRRNVYRTAARYARESQPQMHYSHADVATFIKHLGPARAGVVVGLSESRLGSFARRHRLSYRRCRSRPPRAALPPPVAAASPAGAVALPPGGAPPTRLAPASSFTASSELTHDTSRDA